MWWMVVATMIGVLALLIASPALLRDVFDFTVEHEAGSPSAAVSRSAEPSSPAPLSSPQPITSPTPPATPLPDQAALEVDPAIGKPGEAVTVSGSGFWPGEDAHRGIA